MMNQYNVIKISSNEDLDNIIDYFNRNNFSHDYESSLISAIIEQFSFYVHINMNTRSFYFVKNLTDLKVIDFIFEYNYFDNVDFICGRT